MQISDLRDVPDFVSTIADRCWHEWWTASTVTLAQYRAGLEKMATGHGIPAAFVAHRGDRYAGSVLLIGNDLPSRPQYAPWIAALWVEPEFRRQGIAASLIPAARSRAAALGHRACYLCATGANSPYYPARGFRLIESGVKGLNIFVI